MIMGQERIRVRSASPGRLLCGKCTVFMNESHSLQLYELNPDPKRKQWLDDWLSFMHRNGERGSAEKEKC